MTQSTSDALSKLDSIATDVVARHAPTVDQQTQFPKEAIAALADAGLLGVLSAPEVGGLGLGLKAAAQVVERVARECGSTAMIVCMHYCGVAVLEKHGDEVTRREAARGQHLSTLAFSEAGSRSHFWVPVGTAKKDGDDVVLNANKSWVTSANHAAAYVWSSKPISGNGLSTIWLVPSRAPGISVAGPFDGLGLRGNDSTPVEAKDVRVSESARLGGDGDGFAIMMETVLPIFNVLNAACSLGFMETACEKTAAHAGSLRYQHSGDALAELPTIRAYVARMRIRTDMARTLVQDTIAAVADGRPDTMLRVLESKAACGEAVTDVLNIAMRVCGGSAFRKEVGIERIFRDARAAGVMAPTTDVLYDFIGKAACGMELF